MRLVTVAFASAKEFLIHYANLPPAGAVFVRTKTEADVDEALLVEISFPELPNRAVLRTAVTQVKPNKGMWLSVDPGDKATLDFAVGVARGDVKGDLAAPREHPRFPASLPVEYTIDEQVGILRSYLEDLSAGGAFVRAEASPVVGTKVHVRIDVPGEDVYLPGHVAWVRPGAEGGFGVEFDTHSGDDARRLRALLRRASSLADVELDKGDDLT